MKLLKLWSLPIIWMIVIFSLSSLPGDNLPDTSIPLIDKFAHTVEYVVLGYLLARAFLKSGFNLDAKVLLALAVIVAALYGASDEVHQLFIPNRTCDIFDFVFDVGGATIGAVLFELKK